MKDWFSLPRVCVCVLIPVLLVSYYFSVVPSVELAYGGKLLRSVALFDGGSSEPSSCFEISDVVVFRLDSAWANWYTLTVSNGTRDVYVGSGGLDRSKPEVRLGLLPPAFRAKTAYAYSLHVSAFNYPLPGGSVSDSMIGAFFVEGAETSLALNVTYDDESHGLSMDAVLVNGESEPIANQTIGFYLQPDGNDTSLPDRGWVPLGSSVTNEAGRAALSVVYSRDGGCHKVQARFTEAGFENATADAFFTIQPQTPRIELAMESFQNGSKLTARLTGNDGYPLSCRLVYFQFDGSEEKRYAFSDADGLASIWLEGGGSAALGEERVTVTVAEDSFTAEESVSSGQSMIASGLDSAQASRMSSLRLEAPLDGEADEVVVTADTTDWYALMDNTLYCSYTSHMNHGRLDIFFIVDAQWLIGYDDDVRPLQFGDHYLYVGFLDWVPRELYELGNHTVGVYLYDQNATLVAEGSLAVNIDRTPCNTGLLYPGAFVNENLGLTLAYALPRTYAVVNSCPYVYTYRLAPKVSHCNIDYIVDDMTLSTPVYVKVYVNDELEASFPVSGRGLTTVPLSLDFDDRTYWDVKVVVDPAVTAQSEIRRFVTLTKNWVTCGAFPSGEVGYSGSMLGLDETDRTSTVSNATTMETSASLFGEPLMNLSATHIFGRLKTRRDAMRNTPDTTCNFTRFRFFYNATKSTGPAVADVNRDGVINVFDLTAVNSLFGKTLDGIGNWTRFDECDTNGDGVINILDTTRVTSNYMKRVYYLGISDPSAVLVKFYNSSGKCFGQSYLDIQGCVMLPSATRNFTLHWNGKRIGATYEQFSNVSASQDYTDFTGKFRSGLSTVLGGIWLAQSKAAGFTGIRVQAGIKYDPALALTGRLNVAQYFCVMRCPTKISLDFSPKNVTGPSANVTATAYLVDEFKGTPVTHAPVAFLVYRLGSLYDNRTVVTDSSGVANSAFSANYFLYRVEASYKGNSTYLGVNQSVYVDARHFSNMTVKVVNPEMYVGNCTSIALGTGVQYSFLVDVSPNAGGAMGTVSVYLNNRFYASINDYSTFSWTNTTAGTYFFNLTYSGNECNRPCRFSFVVKASLLPLLIHFDASPTKFKLGDTVHLHAFAVVADTNQTFMGGLTFKFLQDGVYPPFHIVNVPSGQVCEASVDWSYPSDGNAHTVTVSVEYAGGAVKYMVEPITLEAYRDTKLMFWVERDNSSRHTFHGKLVTTDGGVVASQPIKAYLNETQIETDLTTDQYGCFTFERNFNPSDKKVAYTVQVSFEGTGSLSAILDATALDGTRYTVCQTTQFNYRPSANMTTIVVEPQATQVTAPTKTPEEMQQEAQNGNWCQVEVKYGWWFPFLEIHIRLNLNPGVEFVYAPLIFDLSMTINDEQDFAQKIEDAFDLGFEVCLGVLVGKFAAALIARGLGRSSPAALVVAIGAYTGISLILSYAANANQKDAKTWLIAYLGCVVSAGGMVAYKALKFVKWGSVIVERILDQTYNYWNAWWASGVGWGLITDFFFVLIDIFLGCLFLYNYNNKVVI